MTERHSFNPKEHFAAAVVLATFRLGAATAGETRYAGAPDGPWSKAQEANQADDAAVTAAIKAKFDADAPAQLMAVDVRTRDGIVDLNGKAPSSAERMRAELLAQETCGARLVRNFIAVYE